MNFATILGTLFKALGLGDLLAKWIDARNERNRGKEQQYNESLEAQNAELRRQADALANAPISDKDIEDKLNRGDF